VKQLIVAGGLLRNAFLMQLYADVIGLPIDVIGSEQGPALGSAVHAAVASGAYPDVRKAAEVIGRVDHGVYTPNVGNTVVYNRLYAEYSLLHDHFGRGGNDVMHRLRAIRKEARRE
jgi:L-ribulokinase